MDIEELKAKRDALEIRLTILIERELVSFKSDTGYSIRSVDVNFTEARSFGSKNSVYIFKNVECWFAID